MRGARGVEGYVAHGGREVWRKTVGSARHQTPPQREDENNLYGKALMALRAAIAASSAIALHWHARTLLGKRCLVEPAAAPCAAPLATELGHSDASLPDESDVRRVPAARDRPHRRPHRARARRVMVGEHVAARNPHLERAGSVPTVQPRGTRAVGDPRRPSSTAIRAAAAERSWRRH